MSFSKTIMSSITINEGDSIDYFNIEIKDAYYTKSLENLYVNNVIHKKRNYANNMLRNS